MNKTQEFIQKAILVHGDKYDYSKVIYTKAINKVIIICKKHGEYEQRAISHLRNMGCSKCSGVYKYNTKEFIEKVKEIHGDKYDYSKIIYKSNKDKIIIICKEHGEFKILPSNFIKGQNCNICSNRKKLTNEEFIEKSINTHGKNYDYSKINYQGMHKKIIIICKEHGKFNQTPSEHLNKKRGCFKCLGIVCDLNSFIEKSINTHGEKYDYSKVIYNGYKKKVIIICKIHGEFQQTPGDHYQNGSGCQKCANNQFSKSQIIWLNFLSKLYNIHIQHAINDCEYKIPNTKWKADGYCKETNTIFEYHGDFWHGNPKIYKPDDMNDVSKRTMGTLYKRTINREQKIKELGYNLEVMWESDWNKINKSISILQKKFRKCKSQLIID